MSKITGLQRRKIQSIYRQWLKDEAYFAEIAPRPGQEFDDFTEVLRNLGSAIAYAQAIVSKHDQALALSRADGSTTK